VTTTVTDLFCGAGGCPTSVAQHLHPRVRAHAQVLEDGLALPAGCEPRMNAEGTIVIDTPKGPISLGVCDGDPYVGWWWRSRRGPDRWFDALHPTAQGAVDAALTSIGVKPAPAVPQTPSLFEQQLDLRQGAA
jgi:hypothetical protein